MRRMPHPARACAASPEHSQGGLRLSVSTDTKTRGQNCALLLDVGNLAHDSFQRETTPVSRELPEERWCAEPSTVAVSSHPLSRPFPPPHQGPPARLVLLIFPDVPSAGSLGSPAAPPRVRTPFPCFLGSLAGSHRWSHGSAPASCAGVSSGRVCLAHNRGLVCLRKWVSVTNTGCPCAFRFFSAILTCGG